MYCPGKRLSVNVSDPKKGECNIVQIESGLKEAALIWGKQADTTFCEAEGIIFHRIKWLRRPREAGLRRWWYWWRKSRCELNKKEETSTVPLSNWNPVLMPLAVFSVTCHSTPQSVSFL